MGADCCGSGATFEGLSADYRRRLWIVIAINATMFFVDWALALLPDRKPCKPTPWTFWATHSPTE